MVFQQEPAKRQHCRHSHAQGHSPAVILGVNPHQPRNKVELVLARCKSGDPRTAIRRRVQRQPETAPTTADSPDETAKIADRKTCLVIRWRCPQELAEHSTAPSHPFLWHETPCSSLPPPMDGAQTSHPHQWIVKTGGLAPDPRPQSAESDGTRQGRGACKTGSVALLSTRSLGFTPLNELCATS